MRQWVSVLAGCAVACCTATTYAGKYNKVVDLGQPAPAWEKLPAALGKTYSLHDFDDAKAVVVVFFANHCYAADAYEPRLLALEKEFRDQGVQFVFISVSQYEEDQLPHMKQRAEERKIVFPYLHDSSQRIARAYGASVTPQAFVLDGERKIAYMGAVDDDWEFPDKVERPYLKDAITAVLAGDKPEIGESRATGCGIEYVPLK